MENRPFSRLDSDHSLNYGTAVNPTSGGLSARPASPTAKQADQPSGGQALPLLRLSGWDSEKQYDKHNPMCIHYDFQWKISQREKIRARRVFSDTDPDLVLAPSDFWKAKFHHPRLDNYLKDEDKFPEDKYTCEERIIEGSVEKSLDEHLEGLSDLFSIGRKITLSMEFVYKEVACDSVTAKGKKKKKRATEAQRLQRAAEAGLWTRVYEQYRCKAKHCKQGPHCWPDERGIHQKLLPAQLEEIVGHIKETMKEGETEEDVDVGIEIPPHIIKNILENNRKRKADGSIDYQGDRQAMLEEYCNCGLAQVESERWRQALQIRNQVAMNQFLELNTILQHLKVVVELMVKNKVAPGIALQFVSNIKKFQREIGKS
ncbi:hypothetical protein BKA61DRAFT_560880 [Leptodontidium sp. MPI-SDFR-AT-0119]|nr:hypothetical protein BKA61DRAFT_560880 [Leptodontidium sp. MPI-SDFR-AT-0119]